MAAIHNTPSPLAGKTVTLKAGIGLPPGLFAVEDYWDRVGGRSWQSCDGNPACLNYAARAGFAGLPMDDEVLYGKIGGLGYLVHVSEVFVTDGN